MAQVEPEEILRRVVSGDFPSAEGIAALVDRDAGVARVREGQLIDFKRTIDLSQSRGIGELARDTLGFSNSLGGVILFGVDDTGRVLGHPRLDRDRLRIAVGPCVGTRVIFEIGYSEVNVKGQVLGLPFVLVHRTTSATPGLLQFDIELRKGVLQKVKYLRGSLPYRDGSETKVEPAGGDIAEVARRLNFTLVAPRTIGSLLVTEDRPGVRLYGHINDRFIGREDELATLLGQFEDVRGRGVSIGGLGGIGKTELGIALVSRLHRQKMFQLVYSGSAKRMVMGPLGVQEADPMFFDFPSFLQDLSAWLGIESSGKSLLEMQEACLKKLATVKRVLLFVDNLETIEDARLFDFLDHRLPSNVWLVATSRVHRIKNYIFAYDLREMAPRDAAKLLRIELRRQGLDDLAGKSINELERMCGQLLNHPLAIRWFAWACKGDRNIWQRGPGSLPKDDLEDFTVGHTLRNLSNDAVEVLAAIAAGQGQTDVDKACIGALTAKRPDVVDSGLYELESAGLVSVATSLETGRSTYGVVQLALTPIREIIRQKNMEPSLAARLKTHVKRPLPESVDPLVRYLANIEVASVRLMEPSEIEELLRRIERAKVSAGRFELELLQLQAECERQLNRPMTAYELYRSAAQRVLENPEYLKNERFQRLLLEAATVARQRGLTPDQLNQTIIRYLEALPDFHVAPLRIPGMLCEAHAGLKNRAQYDHYRQVVRDLLDDEQGSFSDEQRNMAEAALTRAAHTIEA